MHGRWRFSSAQRRSPAIVVGNARSAGNSSVSAGGEDTLAVDDQEAYNRPPASRPLSSAIAVVSIRPDPALAGREMKITPEADVRG
jgi:hypothetical protein